MSNITQFKHKFGTTLRREKKSQHLSLLRRNCPGSEKTNSVCESVGWLIPTDTADNYPTVSEDLQVPCNIGGILI